MSFYTYIAAQQSPFDIGKDGNNRNQRSVNFLARIRGTAIEPEKELGTKLQSDGVAIINNDTSGIFFGIDRQLPTTDGPHIRVITQSGLAPRTTRDNNTYQSIGIQVIITAKSPDTCREKADAVFTSLHDTCNSTLTV